MAIPNSLREIYLEALRMLLRPFVRFCIRRSISIQDFLRISKGVFIDIAVEELMRSTEAINASRIAVLTGLHRNEVARLYSKKEPIGREPASILGRVIGHWRHDKRFVDKSGEPRVLAFRGRASEFRKLVTSVSKNINPGTILLELERIQAIERTEQGIRLVKQMSGFSGDPLKGYELLSSDLDTLIRAAEENMVGVHETSNLHARTEYDNIDTFYLTQIRTWLVEEGKAFHRRAREYFSQFDLDITPVSAKGKSGGQVILGAFGWTTAVDKEQKSDE